MITYRFREKPKGTGSKIVLILGKKGEEKEIDLGILIAKNGYDNKTQSIPQSPTANALLQAKNARLVDCINSLQLAQIPLTVANVANSFEGKAIETAPAFGAVLDVVLAEYEAHKRQTYKKHTVQTRQRNIAVLREFLEKEFGGDVALRDFKPLHADNLWAFLTQTKGLAPETARRYVETAKRVYQIANANGWYEFDPFKTFHIKGRKKDIDYLRDEEIQAIESLDLEGSALSFERALFVFLLETGLSYTDLETLDFKEIREVETGLFVIEGTRNKNGCSYFIPISPKAQGVIDKYGRRYKPHKGRVFYVPTNQHLNRVLKTIGTMAGITRLEITCHLARKTCATVLATKGHTTQYITKFLGHATYKNSEKYYAVNTAEMVLNQYKEKRQESKSPTAV